MTLAIRRREYPPSPPPQRHFCLDIFYSISFFATVFFIFKTDFTLGPNKKYHCSVFLFKNDILGCYNR